MAGQRSRGKQARARARARPGVYSLEPILAEHVPPYSIKKNNLKALPITGINKGGISRRWPSYSQSQAATRGADKDSSSTLKNNHLEIAEICADPQITSTQPAARHNQPGQNACAHALKEKKKKRIKSNVLE